MPGSDAAFPPHPLKNTRLFGHAEAEQEMASAICGNRLPHAWLICGARGIGKATLAWRAVKFMFLRHEHGQDGPVPTSLDTPDDHPAVQRIVNQSELTVLGIGHMPDSRKEDAAREGIGPHAGMGIRRGKRSSTNEGQDTDAGIIAVDEIRRLKGLSGLTAADGKPLVAVIDSADELNVNSANVLLKLLEEPQPHAVFFLVCHRPARLLPTIRSRCRRLNCNPLESADVERVLREFGIDDDREICPLVRLSEGSPGDVLRLRKRGGIARYDSMVELMLGAPGLSRSRVHELTERGKGDGNRAEAELDLELLLLCVSRLARRAVPETALVTPSSEREELMFRTHASSSDAATSWSELHARTLPRLRKSLGANIDAAALMFDLLLEIDCLAGKLAR